MQSFKKLRLALTLVLILCLTNSFVESRRWGKSVKLHLHRESNHTKILKSFHSQKLRLKEKLSPTTTTDLEITSLTVTGTTLSKDNLINSHNTEYYVTASFGSPQSQQATLLVDTASANLLVYSSEFVKTSCSKHNGYNSSLSQTYQANGTAFQIQFASQDVLTGILSTDTFTLGDLAVKNQTFAEINSSSQNLCNRSNFDGILGLGLPQIAIDGVTTPLDNIVDQGLIDDPIFSFYVNRNASDASNGGELLLGGSDPTLYSGCLTYVPLSKVGFWQITVGQVKIGSKKLCSNCQAIFDVGTSLIIVPCAGLKIINKKLGLKETDKKNGVYIIDCSKVSKLPNIVLNIGWKDFTLTPSDYVLNYSGTCVSGFSSLSDCKGEQINDDGEDLNDLWVLGDVFFGAFFVLFDFGLKLIGVAPKV
ncbi:LOW QUALITY PROTEIN: aspartic proteinase A1 [Drosophila eugracilis]|uniref:LOW QUALITY PROTEIN: aspartic proteinase A1 n=1 Tax=Drosophila eugracilis TaxID=29029 RepID=UPI001BD9AA9D|nr:LOW QUALITY PROTEIN: aspartic proteinase A1 [Drosophila eugracilis]